MKKYLLAVAVLATGVLGYAAQVNPTSNVLGDTAGTAGTLVLRDSNGVVDAANLIQDATIATAKLASDSVATAKIARTAVTTDKFWLDLPTSKIACISSSKKLGTCTTMPTGVADTGCTCTAD